MPSTRSRHATGAQSVTDAREARTEDQARRLKRYLVTMSIRTACFVLLVVIDEWYRWVFAAGAVFLPIIAVVAANAVRPGAVGRVSPVVPRADDSRQITRRSAADGSAADGSDTGRSAADGSATDR